MAKQAKPKTEKKPKEKKEPKAKIKAAAPEAKGSTPGDNLHKPDPKLRELARHHRDKFITVKAAVKAAAKRMRDLTAQIKADGLTVRQIRLMVDLMTPEGEAAWKATIAGDLMAAQYQGAAIGQQLSLFLEPDRTPAVDIAYDQGTQDCIDGKAARSPYDPSVPQTASYLKGFADEQERRLKNGIKKLEPEDQTARAAALGKARGMAAEAETKH